MKIAQVSPLFESVPPKLYGGTERVVHFLTEELVRQGHEVTLFASSDSQTSAKLVAHTPGLRLAQSTDPLAHHLLQLDHVIERADEFDIIHFHTDYLHYPFSRMLQVPRVTTLHGRLDLPELQPMYNRFPEPVVSISFSQRKPLPQAQWVGNVYHGLPNDLFFPGTGAGGYLAFLGRISPEKGPERAIAIAKRAGMKLKIAAKVDKADQEYFDTQIRHLLDDPMIEFVGEVNEEQKQEFLGNAAALLFPINWSEPFGMVLIEAMACGTPVIAFGMGSVPEIIANGFNGFIVSSVEQAVKAVQKVEFLAREEVRDYFEKRFTAERMAHDYLHVYQQLVAHEDAQRKEKKNGHLVVMPIDTPEIKSRV